MNIRRRRDAIVFSIAWYFGRRYLRRRARRSASRRARKLVVAVGLAGLLGAVGWAVLRLRRPEPAAEEGLAHGQEPASEVDPEPAPDDTQHDVDESDEARAEQE